MKFGRKEDFHEDRVQTSAVEQKTHAVIVGQFQPSCHDTCPSKGTDITIFVEISTLSPPPPPSPNLMGVVHEIGPEQYGGRTISCQAIRNKLG